MSRRWSWDEWRASVERLLDVLDWRRLGELYFHEDGERRWEQLRPGVLELGEAWARELLRRVPATGRSLWVGAGVADLPAMLAEVLVRGREVHAVNLRSAECEILAAGLREAGLPDDVAPRAEDARDAAAPSAFDHLAVVSVFTDPETWPVLSDVTYGRIAPVQVDVEAFVQQRDEARALAQRLFAALSRPAWITTSVDEASWFLEQAELAGVAVTADEVAIDSAVVGDPIGFLSIGG